MAIVTYNDNGTIKVVKFGNYVVSTDADPVAIKDWVFVTGSATPWGTEYENISIQDEDYLSAGCQSPSILKDYLITVAGDPMELAAGTRASIRFNLPGSTCGTWARFEVQAVDADPVTATFDSNGGSPTYSSQSGYNSLNVTNPGTPTRDGYTFTGWSPTLPRTITSDTTFVAQWEVDADPVPREWVFDRGSSSSQGTIYEVAGLQDPYSLDSGCSSSIVLKDELTTLSNPNNLAVGTTASIRMNVFGGNACDTWAIFKVQEVDADPVDPVTATFDSNGGSPTYTSQSGYDSLSVTSPGTPTRSGYTFTGWSPTLPQTITSDTTFVAQWEVAQKQWGFLNGMDVSPGTGVLTVEVPGIIQGEFASQGCAPSYTLLPELESQYPASELSVGTRGAVRMNANVGGETCDTWALFEVKEV